MELAYCCINTNARNFARLGALMLNGGRFGEQQLVPADYVAAMVEPAAAANYGYSTWLYDDGDLAHYSLRGHLGQYVVVVPEHDLIVVRLGTRRDDPAMNDGRIRFYVEQALTLLPPVPVPDETE